MLSVRRYRDTSLIEITVTGTEPELTAQLADYTAEVFERQRLEVRREQTERGIEKLREGLTEQLARVHTAQAEVERLRKELNIPIIGNVKLSDLTLQQLEQRLTEARVDAVGQESRLNQLRTLSPLQLRNTIATLINDPHVTRLLQDVTDAELKLEVLKQDYGPDHPQVQTTQAGLEKLREQLDDRLAGVMRGFEAELQVVRDRVAELQRDLERAKQASLALEGERYLPFRNAEREEELEMRMYEALKQRLQQESVELELPRSPVEVIDQAEIPMFPVRPRMTMNLAVGGVAGLVLGIVVAFLLEFLDTSVKRLEDVEQDLGLPVLGVVPQRTGLVGRDEATPAQVEAYRVVRTNLEFHRGDPSVKSYCVLSAAPGEGKSFTAVNLACVCAQHGERVLLVDCDLRRPTLHQVLGADNAVGLAEYLADARSLEEVIQPSGVPNVDLVTAGQATRSRVAVPLVTSTRMRGFIEEVSSRYDLVLYDTPPVLGVSEAAVLARDVGHSILVIQHRRYPRHMARRARQIIDSSGGRLLGVVVNQVALAQADTYSYYHHQYDDYLRGPTAKPAADGAPPRTGQDQIQLGGKY
ncbi:polysaccharide biosynthesis tyrosine autokinase [bacterium]|nr:polysaccharide biosynthesis tyrosine autokinase [bacterium]